MESDIAQSAAYFKLLAWLEAHKKQILWTAIAVLVVGAGVGFFLFQQDKKQLSANEALSRITIRTGANAAVESPEAFVKVAQDYPNTDAGGRALVLAGTKFFTDGKYAEAETQFRKYLSEYQNAPFASQALLGVAASLDAQGKTNEAIAAYRDITEHHPDENVVPQARLSLARLYETQGKLVEARDGYEQVAQAGGRSLGSEAMMRLQELLDKHPDLRATNAAPASTPALNLK